MRINQTLRKGEKSYAMMNIKLKISNRLNIFQRTLFPEYLLLCFLFLTLWNSSIHGQSQPADSMLLLQQVNGLIQKGNYATAHILLEEYIEQHGMKPDLTTLMISNGLTHYYRHENYDFFLLKDAIKTPPTSNGLKSQNLRIGRLRYPQRILENLLQQYPDYGYIYKLLGDYYDIQLQDLNNIEFIKSNNLKVLEEKIFSYYSQAENNGYKDYYLCRWLGDYYVNNNQLDLAEKYYQRNIGKSISDPISLYRLAEINYQKKLYTQAYNFAQESIKYFPAEDIYLKYDAMRISANSLKELGEYDRFLEIINESIQLIPDLQDSYLDLIQFYSSPMKSTKIELLFNEMFMKNPFELSGYRSFENYIVNSENFKFADTLFNTMLFKYENWDEVLANIYWSKGNLAFYQNLPQESGRFWEISRNYMRHYLPANHPVIKQVGSIALKK
jgi:hypothetical protein